MKSGLTFEEYASWARSRYPEGQAEDVIDQAQAEGRITVPCEEWYSSESVPPTVRSKREGYVITPAPRGSR